MSQLQQMSTLTRQIGRLEGMAAGLAESHFELSAAIMNVCNELNAVLDSLRGVEDAAPYEEGTTK